MTAITQEEIDELKNIDYLALRNAILSNVALRLLECPPENGIGASSLCEGAVKLARYLDKIIAREKQVIL